MVCGINIHVLAGRISDGLFGAAMFVLIRGAYLYFTKVRSLPHL
jgi:hypothetical protein